MANVSAHGGHNEKVQGANWGNRKEHIMDRELKDKFISKLRSLGHNVKDDTDDSGSTASQIVNNQVRNINSRTNEVGFSFHLNAFNGQANGVEVLCYSEKELPMASKISTEIAKRTGWFNRGGKIRPDIGVIRSTNCPVFLIEAGFIDNDNDMAKWNSDAIADAIIYAYFGQNSGDTSPKVETYDVLTGGFHGQGLNDMHTFLVANGYWNFTPKRDDNLNIRFEIKGFDKAAFEYFKGFMREKDHNWDLI